MIFERPQKMLSLGHFIPFFFLSFFKFHFFCGSEDLDLRTLDAWDLIMITFFSSGFSLDTDISFKGKIMHKMV